MYYYVTFYITYCLTLDLDCQVFMCLSHRPSVSALPVCVCVSALTARTNEACEKNETHKKKIFAKTETKHEAKNSLAHVSCAVMVCDVFVRISTVETILR